MSVPMIKRITRAAPGALNVFANATDDVTALTFIRVVKGTALIDLVNEPDPAAGLTYTIALWKNGVDTGRRFYSSMSSAASAGRVPPGPINLGPGDYFFQVAQTAGALTAQSFALKFASDPGKS